MKKEKEENILTNDVAKRQDEIVQSVVGNKTLSGFQKAHLVSSAIVKLREMMTPEYMAPIMALQGNRIGFKTDKDIVRDPSSNKYVKGPGYLMEAVRECVIEATLKGLQVTGNEFNIIGGNTYPTLEGMRSLLRQIPNFTYKVKPGIPEVNENKTLATFKKVDITWSIGGSEHQESIEIQIKIDSYASVDSMIGKAKRKSYAWLYETVTGEEISDGEVEDIPHTEVSSTPSQTKKTATLPDFTRDNFEKAKNANATVEKIKERYIITPEVEKEYIEYVNSSEK